ncbi:MAG: 5-formyltetrahydrofolate cyclo-ligase [Myxococcales bacterium]
MTEIPGYSPEQIEALRVAAKEELRRRVAALRRTLVAETRQRFSLAMCEQLIESGNFKRAKVVAAYSALRFEIDPRALVERACALGKIVGLPRFVANTGTLELARYEPGDELVETHFMVKEPRETAQAIELTSVDLVLVPGLAFDTWGQRLGFGQGYYDRFLPGLPNAVRVGLCFELQLLAEVPATTHDVPVDHLATERRMLVCER